MCACAPVQLLLETNAPDMQPLVRTRLELSVGDFFATFWADNTTFFTDFLESRGQDCTVRCCGGAGKGRAAALAGASCKDVCSSVSEQYQRILY